MTIRPQTFLPQPDPPERKPDDMTSVQHLGGNGNPHHLAQHLGNSDSTIVSGGRYTVPELDTSASQRINPDILVSFNADPALYGQDYSYVISRQGKPPDLVMEIASRGTDRRSRCGGQASQVRGIGNKRVPAVRRNRQFPWNQSGRRPAGRRRIPAHRHRHSARRENQELQHRTEPDTGMAQRQLNRIDPDTGEHIPTFQQERVGRLQAESRADQERDTRVVAEARNRELEAELRILKGEYPNPARQGKHLNLPDKDPGRGSTGTV